MDLLRQLYAAEQFVAETRSPIWIGHVGTEYVLQVFVPNPVFFLQIAIILALQMIAGCLLSTIMYYGIVVPRRLSSSTVQAALIGYGLVIPFSAWLPFYMVDILDIRSIAFRLGFCSLPMTVTLRCLHAMHGDLNRKKRVRKVDSTDSDMSPPPTQYTLWEYVVSVAFIVSPRLDSNGDITPLTAPLLRELIMEHIKGLGTFALVFNLFHHVDFAPLPTFVNPQDTIVAFDLGVIYNTFLQAGKCNAE